MSSLVPTSDFPLTAEFAYLNTANVALMPRVAEEAIVAWQRDVARHGSLNFDEVAEANAFKGLHEAAAKLFRCQPEDIAGGSSATALLSSLAWAKFSLLPSAGSGGKENFITTDIAFPSTAYPWLRVAQQVGAEMRFAAR